MRGFFLAAQLMFLVGFVDLARAESPGPDDSLRSRQEPIEVAEAYLAAMESRDLETAGALFSQASSIFESGGQEGDWQHYVEHHIGPELGEIETFVITRGEPEVQASRDQTMVFVALPIEYRIVLRDQRVIESTGTVTFVMVGEDRGLRIRHLHWSSRRKKPADG